MENFGEKGIHTNEIQSVPQVNEQTGLSYDYINEYALLVTFYDSGGIDEVKEYIKAKKFRLMGYEEYFKASGNYKDIVTEKNKIAVEKINELVAKLNHTMEDVDNLDERLLLKSLSEIHMLIKGTSILSFRDFFDK